MNKTLFEARTKFFTDLPEGTTCPCCDRHGQKYKYTVTSSMALTLVWFWKLTEHDRLEWKHLPSIAPKWVLRSNCMGKLVHWKLVETRENTNPKVKTSGRYKITPAGIGFCNGNAVNKYCHVYNNQVYGYSGEPVTLREALNQKFDYSQVMSGIYE